YLLVLVALVFIVGAGPPPATNSETKQALWAAAKKGDAAQVKLMLARGADVNAKTAYGATALSFAADKGHLEVVKVLVKHKADVNVRDTYYGFAPLDWAVMNGHVGVVRSLVEAGARVDDVLAAAAAAGQFEMVQVMLEKGKPKAEALNAA